MRMDRRSSRFRRKSTWLPILVLPPERQSHRRPHGTQQNRQGRGINAGPDPNSAPAPISLSTMCKPPGAGSNCVACLANWLTSTPLAEATWSKFRLPACSHRDAGFWDRARAGESSRRGTISTSC